MHNVRNMHSVVLDYQRQVLVALYYIITSLLFDKFKQFNFKFINVKPKTFYKYLLNI